MLCQVACVAIYTGMGSSSRVCRSSALVILPLPAAPLTTKTPGRLSSRVVICFGFGVTGGRIRMTAFRRDWDPVCRAHMAFTLVVPSPTVQETPSADSCRGQPAGLWVSRQRRGCGPRGAFGAGERVVDY